MPRKQKTFFECRLPSSFPSFSVMLDDVGAPPFSVLARVFGVSEPTVKRWVRTDNPPLSVLYATFWLTSWGRSFLHVDAENSARLHAGLYESLLRQNKALVQQVETLQRFAHFSSANSPVLGSWAA